MFNLEYQEILTYITTWGYPIMFLLMIIEGPVVTLGAAFLASMGFFNVFVVLSLSVLGDIIGDTILYYIGFFSKNGFKSKEKPLLKTNPVLIKTIENSFKKKGAQIIFFTKATIGLGYITFILAGISKISFKKFLFWSFLGGTVWSFFIVVLGYYFGILAEEIEKYIKYSGWLVFLLAILILLSLIIYKKTIALKKMKNKLNN